MRTRLLLGAVALAGLALPVPSAFGQEDFAKLNAEFQQANSAFQKEMQELRSQGVDRADYNAAYQQKNPVPKFLDRFREGAKENEGTEAAVPYLNWIVANAARVDAEATADAATTLCEDHAASEDIATAVAILSRMGRTLGYPKVRELLSRVIEENEHEAVLVQAHFGRAQATLDDPKAGEDLREQALADLRRVAESEDERLAKRASGQIFVQENLQIGMKAPDIVAEDLDGVEFKLSDYRGKVVVLDFWGDW